MMHFVRSAGYVSPEAVRIEVTLTWSDLQVFTFIECLVCMLSMVAHPCPYNNSIADIQ